jgi:spore germination protein YaaH
MKVAMAITMTSLASIAALGCWAGQDVDRTGDHVVARPNAVVVEGCALDDAETTTLSQPSTKKVLGEVILLCAAIQPDATIAPAAADDRTALTAQVQSLHTLGYRVHIATTVGTSWDVPASSADTTKLIETVNATTLAASLKTLVTQAGADGLDLAFPPPTVDGVVNDKLTSLVEMISGAFRPALALDLFVPPSSQSPSDVEGGDAYAINALGQFVDRLRIMTLDYSCCGAPLGPTIDPGWAVDVQRFNVQPPYGGGSGPRWAATDVAYPLYGWDTTISSSGDTSTQSSITYAQAESLAATTHASVQRGPTGAPYFDYTAGDATKHEVWFDDATSTLHALHAWNDALPADVGVVFYGLGAEDPRLWTMIAQEMP